MIDSGIASRKRELDQIPAEEARLSAEWSEYRRGLSPQEATTQSAQERTLRASSIIAELLGGIPKRKSEAVADIAGLEAQRAAREKELESLTFPACVWRTVWWLAGPLGVAALVYGFWQWWRLQLLQDELLKLNVAEARQAKRDKPSKAS